MYTQIDSLARTVNGLVEHNSENINTLVKQDIVGGWILIGLAGLLGLVLIFLLVYLIWLAKEEPISRIFWEIKDNKVEKIVNNLYNDTEFMERMKNDKKLRKYEIRNHIVNLGIKQKLVDRVTDRVWRNYKYDMN